MECQRLNKMIRAWYVQVQDETLAPARMVEFMEKHVAGCDECLMDLGIQEELKKIKAIVLPVSKMTKPPKGPRPDAADLPPPRVFEKDAEGDVDEEESGEEEESTDEDDDEEEDDDIEVEDEDFEEENVDHLG